MILTRRGVCGAIIEPKRPNMEHIPKSLWRIFVGKNSVVYRKITVKDTVIANFPIKYILIFSHF